MFAQGEEEEAVAIEEDKAPAEEVDDETEEDDDNDVEEESDIHKTFNPTPPVTYQAPTPYTTLRKILDHPRYDAVRQVLSNSDEGVLSKYTFTPEPSSPCFKALIAPEPMKLPVKELSAKGKKRLETRKKYFKSRRH